MIYVPWNVIMKYKLVKILRFLLCWWNNILTRYYISLLRKNIKYMIYIVIKVTVFPDMNEFERLIKDFFKNYIWFWWFKLGKNKKKKYIK